MAFFPESLFGSKSSSCSCLQQPSLPQVYLLIVAFLWGTYSPAVRLIYSQPGPPQPEVLTAVRSCLQAGTLLVTSVAWPKLLESEPQSAKDKLPRSV